MAPFGESCEYEDFAACVRATRGPKTNAEEARRICGALMRDTEEK